MTDELTADFTRSLPGGKMDDSTYEAIESALDKADAPMQTTDGRWLSLAERVAAKHRLTQSIDTYGNFLLNALDRYGFPVSEAASTANMSIEARNLHNAARRFRRALNATGSAADEPAVTNGQ
jgi:hypothetical protein